MRVGVGGNCFYITSIVKVFSVHIMECRLFLPALTCRVLMVFSGSRDILSLAETAFSSLIYQPLSSLHPSILWDNCF